MNLWRQRGLLVLCLLLTGCQARTSADAAQTAVAVAQTAIPALPSMADQLRPLLPGVALDVTLVPSDAPNDQVTQVNITGTDGAGALAQVDPIARDAATSTALTLVSRYYPKATIVLDVRDSSGTTVVHASRAPQ